MFIIVLAGLASHRWAPLSSTLGLMTDRLLSARKAEEELEPLDSDDELPGYLDELAPYIGWIIIYFNSLEDIVCLCIREAILRDPYQDERVDVFLAEMLFAAKCRALMHLYGQLIETGGVKFTHDDLTRLEETLLECAKRRNEYAHADWIGLMKESYVKVKTQSKKRGIMHRYRKFDVAQLESDVEFISAARDALEAFNEAITDQLWGRA
jgi:hypothetical protein